MQRTLLSPRLWPVVVAAAALMPAAAMAHGGATERPGPDVLLTGWEFDPLFLVPLGALCWAFVAAVRSVNRAHPASPVPTLRVVYFFSGVAALVLAIASPIAAYDTDLFSVHMVQHVIILMVAAPFLLLSAPITLALRVATPRFRKEVILPVLHSRVVRAISFPVLTWAVLTTVLWVSHYSSLFNGALEDEWLHRLEHVLYLGAALLFWWPVTGADPSPWRMNHPLKMLYVFMQMPQNSWLAVSIANSTSVIFPHYETVNRTWGPSPLSDQEWAGYIMWVLGDIAFLVALAALAYGWVQHEERAAKRGDRARAREKAAALKASADGSSAGS